MDDNGPGVPGQNYQRVSDFGNNRYAIGQRDTDLTDTAFDAIDMLPPDNNSAPPRDFLVTPEVAVGSSPDRLLALMAQQNDLLQDIAQYLRKQVADVLCTVVVERSGQQGTQSIQDALTHKVWFEVGGKPVPIYSLLAFSTWTGTVNFSILSMGNANDGIPMIAGDVINLNVPIDGGVFVRSATASSGTPLIVNGPADPANGGLFLYGFTTPDWDRIRGAVRSMP